MRQIGCTMRTTRPATKPVMQPIGMRFVEGGDFPSCSYGIHFTSPITLPAAACKPSSQLAGFILLLRMICNILAGR